MDFNFYILLATGIATTFFVGTAIALHWAHKNGQFSNLDKGAQSIFDDDEPLGKVTDRFPVSRKKRAAKGK